MNQVRHTGARVTSWVHFIKQTLDILRTEFRELSPEPNRKSYKYETSDVLLVAVLRRKLTRRNPCIPATPDDLTYWFIAVKRKIPVLTPVDAIPKL